MKVMAENKENETVPINDQIEQLKQQIEELTENQLHFKKIIEQIETDLLHEIKQRENNQRHVQVISSFNKDEEISAYVEENRSFIQSIWKRRK